MDTKFFLSLSSPVVRDLYWLIFEPSPIKEAPEGFSIPLFPRSVIKEWSENSCDYFRKLDQSSQEIESFVSRSKNKRLGFYCESLLSYFFQTFPGITLWLQNIQLHEEKRTVGEIDFVISWRGKSYHIELAVKYYLLLPDSNPKIARNWIGPSRKDDLHKKLTKVQQHQLPLGKHQSVQKRLPKSITDAMNSYFLFRGHFFAHNEVDCTFLNKKVSNYYFEHEVKKDSCQLLIRPDWLGSLKSSYEENMASNLQIDRPQLVKFKNGENSFVVPGDWNKNAY